MVIEGDVEPEYIKGSKYRRVNLDEYKHFWSSNTGKALAGLAGLVGVGGLGAYGIHKIKQGVKDEE